MLICPCEVCGIQGSAVSGNNTISNLKNSLKLPKAHFELHSLGQNLLLYRQESTSLPSTLLVSHPGKESKARRAPIVSQHWLSSTACHFCWHPREDALVFHL